MSATFSRRSSLVSLASPPAALSSAPFSVCVGSRLLLLPLPLSPFLSALRRVLLGPLDLCAFALLLLLFLPLPPCCCCLLLVLLSVFYRKGGASDRKDQNPYHLYDLSISSPYVSSSGT